MRWVSPHLEGPEVSLATVEARIRFVKLLGSGVDSFTWPHNDKAAAKHMVEDMVSAGDSCANSSDDWRCERRRLGPCKIPLWKELGEQEHEQVRCSTLLPTAHQKRKYIKGLSKCTPN